MQHGGCFDSVQDLLADKRIRVIHQANSTKPVAINRALDQVRGELFTQFKTGMTISYPTRIERQVCALLNKPRLGCRILR